MRKLLIYGLITIFILSIPRLIWLFEPEHNLDIAVIDKTVPSLVYREHLGLFQMLRDEKVMKLNGESYDIGNDYFGYNPYDKQPFPLYDRSDRSPDLIYIADTYGVYSDDLKEGTNEGPSELIYGGMTLEEWNAIMRSKKKETLLISEFNSFAAPTDQTTSSIMQKNLGVNWSGWTGRYFQALEGNEVPAWLKELYTKYHSTTWDFKKSGIVFVKEKKVVVLDGANPPEFTLTKNGRSLFDDNVKNAPYYYWFDVVEEVGESKVLADYKFHLSEAQIKQLQEEDLSTTIPAVIYQPEVQTYYFAGDFADISKKTFSAWKGAHWIYKALATGNEKFYWNSYVPLMKHIIHRTYEKGGIKSEG